LIYTWSFGELLSASVRLDSSRISTVRTLLDTIGGAFTQAAAAVAVAADTNGVTLAAKA
jgi:flagellin-specific chaperone FliS